ncbi:putative basic amino acid antiporter YfcC [Shewanella sp. JM162201]|uniref:Basic amino acid antiporter YfcC n=2 Tax=Shewanella jiangmenensis TaxID=2837387 RepID=A0ABS5V5L4_9GAMM|nr:putative basic amino acid antiporter YfcC [Shewanella jiangmenensis]
MPDTLVLIFFVALFAALLTYLVPVGSFDTQTVTFMQDGVEKSREVVNPDSFRYALDDEGEPRLAPVEPFDASGKGFFNYMFEGLVSGDKWGSAIGVIMFMLVIGGSFGIVMATGTIDNGILRLIHHTQGREFLFIPVLFALFSLGGAVFGMGEEAIAFAIIIYPLMLRLGYDGITTVMVTYVATQVGFGASWMNPFSVAIAQGIAGIPVMSGAAVRIPMWVGFTLLGIAFTLHYARKVKRSPELSYSFATDAQLKHAADKADESSTSPGASRFNLGDMLVLAAITATMGWVIWGVVVKHWFIPEIASQFFTMGLVVGVIGVVFKLNGLTANGMAKAFKDGAATMLEPCLLVGSAAGILILLGKGGPTEPSVLNSILSAAGGFIGGLPDALSAWFMLLFQSVFNFFVTSGSGQAALTMPLMAPLADIVGVSRQVAVLAFQLGDGFTNVLVPTSASLMATLGVCRVEFSAWLKFIWRFMLLIMAAASVMVIGAHYLGFS